MSTALVFAGKNRQSIFHRSLLVIDTILYCKSLNDTTPYSFPFQPAGFSLEISNTSSSTVMVGIRIQVGSQAMERAPSYLEVFNRTVQTNVSRSRWYDLPFTREEALTADKKITLFGKSFLGLE